MPLIHNYGGPLAWDGRDGLCMVGQGEVPVPEADWELGMRLAEVRRRLDLGEDEGLVVVGEPASAETPASADPTAAADAPATASGPLALGSDGEPNEGDELDRRDQADEGGQLDSHAEPGSGEGPDLLALDRSLLLPREGES